MRDLESVTGPEVSEKNVRLPEEHKHYWDMRGYMCIICWFVFCGFFCSQLANFYEVVKNRRAYGPSTLRLMKSFAAFQKPFCTALLSNLSFLHFSISQLHRCQRG